MSITGIAYASGTPTYMDPTLLVEEDVFKLLGVADAPEDKKQKLFDTMMKSINNRIFSRVLDLVDDKDAEELERVLEEDGDIDAFLKARQIDVTSIAAQEALIYKTELVALAAA